MNDKSKIAYGVSRETSWRIPFSADYRFNCGCGDTNHGIFAKFDHEKDCNTIWVTFYKKVCWNCYWHTKGRWQEFIKRLSGALTMLFKGKVEFEESFMLFGVEQIDSFIDALQEGKDRLLAYCEKIGNEQGGG